MMRPPVIIIGAHRSGTTATARALELLGLNLGEKLDSHRESKALQRFHEMYLQQYGASWHHPQSFLETQGKAWTTPGSALVSSAGEGVSPSPALENGEIIERTAAHLRSGVEKQFAQIFGYDHGLRSWWTLRKLKQGSPWGWKEPRTTLFVPAWLKVFPKARIIHVIRHPVAVASSIRHRELRFQQAGDPPTPDLNRIDYCLRLALMYVETGDAAKNHGRHFFRLRFESLQENPKNVLQELASFCLLKPDDGELARAAKSIHQSTAVPRLSPEELETIKPMEDELRKLNYELPSLITSSRPESAPL